MSIMVPIWAAASLIGSSSSVNLSKGTWWQVEEVVSLLEMVDIPNLTWDNIVMFAVFQDCVSVTTNVSCSVQTD